MKKRPLFELITHLAHSGAGESAFGGVMRSPSGEFIGYVRGFVSDTEFQSRLAGRPRSLDGDITTLAHLHMLHRAGNDALGLGSAKERSEALTAVNMGDRLAPGNQAKQAKVKIKKAIDELQKSNAICITYVGGDGTRVWFAIEDGEHHIKTLPHGIQIDGLGWHCEFKGKAGYGPITGLIPTGEQ